MPAARIDILPTIRQAIDRILNPIEEAAFLLRPEEVTLPIPRVAVIPACVGCIVRIPRHAPLGRGRWRGHAGPHACVHVILEVCRAASRACREEELTADVFGMVAVVQTYAICKYRIVNIAIVIERTRCQRRISRRLERRIFRGCQCRYPRRLALVPTAPRALLSVEQRPARACMPLHLIPL